MINQLKWDLSRSEAKVKNLAGLLKGVGSKRILVLCHNNPDPDSIAGAYGFSNLLAKKFGIKSDIGYGGVISRAENKAMVQRLRIKMNRLAKLNSSDYHGVALIDAQPGTGNNLLYSKDASPLIVIDHHPLRKASLHAAFHDIRPGCGATSTIITEYLLSAGMIPTRSMANALLYGIKADTNSLTRGAVKADLNAFTYLSTLTNPKVIALIERPALSLNYFEDYLCGLSQTTIYRDVAVSCLGEIHSESIIPELADLLLRLEGTAWSLCMGYKGDEFVLSLRSTSRTYRAGVVLRRIIGRLGSAGGHKEMAGGLIPLGGMSTIDRQELPSKLIKRFLKQIKREGCQPRKVSEILHSRHESHRINRLGPTVTTRPS